MPIKLTHEQDLQENINLYRTSLIKELTNLLPKAIIEEIGSTAIPGCLTKGDLDILVLVAEDDFNYCRCVLEEIYEENKMEDISFFASFKGEVGAIEFGIQLSTVDSKNWDFIAFRDLLRNSPDLVIQYNKVKLDSCHLSMDEYREKKYLFIESVLSKNY